MTKKKKKTIKENVVTASFIGIVSAFSMTFAFNNLSGTNNAVAAKGAMATALIFLTAKALRVI